MSDEDDRPPDETIDPSEVAGPLRGEWTDHYQRPRGILTDTDRQFLWGLIEYDSAPTRSERRSTIRERFVNGIRDLSYLTHLEDKQRETLFSELEEETEPGGIRGLTATFLEFLYTEFDGDTEFLEETVAHGVSNAEGRLAEDSTHYGGTQVDVEIDVSRGHNVDRLEEQLRSGQHHTLTPAEIGVLVREGRVEPDDLEELQPDGLFPEKQHWSKRDDV